MARSFQLSRALILLLCVAATTGCASATAVTPRVQMERDEARGRVVVRMEENPVGGRTWVGPLFGLRAVMVQNDDGTIDHGLWIDTMNGEDHVQSREALVILAGGSRLELRPAAGTKPLGPEGSEGRFYPVTIDDLRTIAAADSVTVEWVREGSSVTRDFDRDNSARFRHWVANVARAGAEPRPQVAAVASAPAVEEVVPPRRQVRVAVAAVNLRTGPGTGHPVLTMFVRDAVLDVLAERGDWLEVAQGEVRGYLHRTTVEEVGEESGGSP